MVPSNRETQTRAVDPRPARTRESILLAIERLGQLESEITIASIVAEAQIARSSFYSRYRDLGDVATQLICEMLAELQGIDTQPPKNRSGSELVTPILDAIIGEFYTRRSLYTAVFSAKGSYGGQHRIHEIFSSDAYARIVTLAPSHVDARNAAVYISSGVLASVHAWLLAGCPGTQEELRDQILAMYPDWMIKATYRNQST